MTSILACRSVVSRLEGQVLKKVISPSLALPQSNAFPMLVTPSSITKVWARTQHAPSFGVMRTAVRLHLRNQTIYLLTVSFCVLPLYVLWAYFITKKGLGRCHKSGTGKITVGGKRLLAITRDLIATTVTEIASRCHYRWYLFLFHWTIQSSIHLSCPRFVNSHQGLHLTVHVITNALIAITLNQRAMSCCHWWYISFPHGMIHSLI